MRERRQEDSLIEIYNMYHNKLNRYKKEGTHVGGEGRKSSGSETKTDFYYAQYLATLEGLSG